MEFFAGAATLRLFSLSTDQYLCPSRCWKVVKQHFCRKGRNCRRTNWKVHFYITDGNVPVVCLQSFHGTYLTATKRQKITCSVRQEKCFSVVQSKPKKMNEAIQWIPESGNDHVILRSRIQGAGVLRVNLGWFSCSKTVSTAVFEDNMQFHWVVDCDARLVVFPTHWRQPDRNVIIYCHLGNGDKLNQAKWICGVFTEEEKNAFVKYLTQHYIQMYIINPVNQRLIQIFDLPSVKIVRIICIDMNIGQNGVEQKEEVPTVEAGEMTLDEAELEPNEFEEKLLYVKSLQVQQMETLKQTRKELNGSMTILEALQRQMVKAHYDYSSSDTGSDL